MRHLAHSRPYHGFSLHLCVAISRWTSPSTLQKASTLLQPSAKSETRQTGQYMIVGLWEAPMDEQHRHARHAALECRAIHIVDYQQVHWGQRRWRFRQRLPSAESGHCHIWQVARTARCGPVIGCYRCRRAGT